jgi:GDPmannose 4,6-dehydratase
MAFQETGLEIEFVGEGVDEKGYLVGIDEKIYTEKVGEQYLDTIKSKLSSSNLRTIAPSHNRPIVEVDPRYFRPTEVDLLIGDATKAKEKLGWTPKYDLNYLVKDMMQSDIALMKKDTYLKQGGYKTLNYFE